LSSTSGGALNKAGTGTLTLSGASSFAGPITIQNGVLATATFANAATNSPLGFGSSAGGLIIDGGTLQFNSGSSATSTRLFSVGPNGGTLECAGAGPLKLTGAGSIGMTGSGDRTLTLAGVNADCEFKFAVGDPSSGKASLRKIDGGRWIMTQAAALTYSGDTIIDAGILIPLSISNILPHGLTSGGTPKGISFSTKDNSNSTTSISPSTHSSAVEISTSAENRIHPMSRAPSP